LIEDSHQQSQTFLLRRDLLSPVEEQFSDNRTLRETDFQDPATTYRIQMMFCVICVYACIRVCM